eukprot:758514-Hanusia_phi.AAC.2
MHKNLPPHVRNDITLPTPACELILPVSSSQAVDAIMKCDFHRVDSNSILQLVHALRISSRLFFPTRALAFFSKQQTDRHSSTHRCISRRLVECNTRWRTVQSEPSYSLQARNHSYVKLPLLHLDSPDQSLPMLHQSFLHPRRFLAEHNVLIPCQVSLSLRSVNMVAQCFECDQECKNCRHDLFSIKISAPKSADLVVEQDTYLLISFASDKEIPMFKCVSNTLEENPSCKLLEMFPVAENSREERVFFLRSQFLIQEVFINLGIDISQDKQESLKTTKYLYFTLILANNPRPFVNHVHKSFGCVVRSLHSQVQVFAFQAQHLLNPSACRVTNKQNRLRCPN